METRTESGRGQHLRIKAEESEGPLKIVEEKQKQTDRHREQTCGYQGGGGVRREGLGVWD